MALGFPNPKNGAVAIAPSTASDFASYDYSESQAVESVAAYGAAVYDPFRASATPHASVSVAGFAKTGAVGVPPGFGATGFTAAGGAATFTVDTGVTLTGNFVVSNIRLSHARLRAAVPLSYQLENAGDVTVTWPTA